MGSEFDGPTLRSVRNGVGVPLRRVARLAGMSHGHLSKLERGEQGRAVTPVVLAAYEKATGVRLADVPMVPDGSVAGETGWRRGQMTDVHRRGFNATVAGVTVGGPVGEPVGRLIDGIGRMKAPERVGAGDVWQVEEVARVATEVDLRCGGGLTLQWARWVLRWAVGLADTTMNEQIWVRLQAAIGQLAQRTAWAAFDAEAHQTAQNLFTVALDAAVQAKDWNLRAHVLADVGAQHTHLGYPDDCTEIVGLVEGDPRVSPAVRSVLLGVKARAHATAGNAKECRQYVESAEQQHAEAVAQPPPGWPGSLRGAGHLAAMTGHALATLARHTQAEADRSDAHHRLTQAVSELDPATHTRAWGLCVSRLALMHLDAGDHQLGIGLAQQALATAAAIRSGRLTRHLHTIRATAAAHPDLPALAQLANEIETTLPPPAAARPTPASTADLTADLTAALE